MPLALCTVTGGPLELPGGGIAAGRSIYLKRTLKNGALIATGPTLTASIDRPTGGYATIFYVQEIKSDAAGLITFTVPRLSTIYMEGNVSGFNNGEVALSIPDAATATLESLVAATNIPATGLTVKSNAAALANLIGTIDFSSDFTVTESPTGEANISLPGTWATDAEVAAAVAAEAVLRANADALLQPISTLNAAVDARIKLLQKWALNFTANGDIYLPAYEAMTVDIGVAAIGTGTLAYAKSTTALPSTFNATTLPVTLEAGAWLKVSVSGIASFKAVELRRTA